ncbi:flavin reductase (DIM6/NTAB) family NADH-FMN oxidoreductase RutF [Paraburkholderia sp. WSM4177]|nr:MULTISPECIES: flavin reductase family protein [unclassified Paraburkholderia]MBB5442688.1 flavin reductase (DIM6/NTAB) family NADH-FMN oxidoreductase RutF [Paraburkholderia sp. WSM4177]MBB5482505.1 flavin reductase (DIM6/NTAB) family NADH-FMN oxidoreductase RutF [Paraburkholderia sp. WSM4180]
MRATAAQTDKPADKAPSPSFDERRFRHALGRFAARVVDRHPCGDHTLFVGEVLVFSLDEHAPLLFFGGRYASVAASASNEVSA